MFPDSVIRSPRADGSRYWWAIGLFLLVQVVVGSGGGGDEGKK